MHGRPKQEMVPIGESVKLAVAKISIFLAKSSPATHHLLPCWADR